ncbi:hypothetical protein P3392_23625, partial [Vibrio parahaemolyticus]|nr:hypothetical protein [Vibrio parahaemolyticus]
TSYPGACSRRAAVTNTDAEEAHEHGHEQAESVAKKHLLHGDTLDSGTATLNRKTYCVSVKVKVATSRGNTTNLYQHLRQHSTGKSRKSACERKPSRVTLKTVRQLKAARAS